MPYRVEGSLEGLAPILFGRWVTDLEAPGGGTATTEDRIAEAEKKVYRDDDGLHIPAWNLKRCLVDGCKSAGLKRGRSSYAPLLMAAVFVETEPHFFAQFSDTERQAVKEYDSMHQATGKRPPRTGGAVLIRRPLLNLGWRLSFALNVMSDEATPIVVQQSLDRAGLFVGLGPWRPEFGRFVVREWKIIH